MEVVVGVVSSDVWYVLCVRMYLKKILFYYINKNALPVRGKNK